MHQQTTYFPDKRLKCPVTLPTDPTRIHHYINLTNGLEAVPRLQKITSNINICRLQSSHCEASRPDLLLQSIDASMLFWLAQGHTVLVYDFGSRNKKRGAPRALWYGLEFLKCALGYIWYPNQRGTGTSSFVRGYNAQRDFEALISKYVDRPTMKKLKYYRQYIEEDRSAGGIHLYGVYDSTEHDADQGYYQQLAKDFFSNTVDSTTTTEHADTIKEMQYVEALGIPFDHTYGKDRMHPLECALGMRLFLGGISHDTFLQFYNDA